MDTLRQKLDLVQALLVYVDSGQKDPNRRALTNLVKTSAQLR